MKMEADRNQPPVIGRQIDRAHAARDLAQLIGLAIDPWRGSEIPQLTEQATARFGRPRNDMLAFHHSAAIPGVGRELVQRSNSTLLPLPGLLNDRPAGVPGDQTILAITRDLHFVSVPGGTICNLAGAPMIIAGDGCSVIEDCSSSYAGLMHFYDVPIAEIVAESEIIEGVVFALFIDADPRNYCHWLIDFLPRLAQLRARLRYTDVYLATPPLSTEFQRETLRLCGFDENRIIPVGEFSALRARELLVLDDSNEFHHPGHNAAPWAVDYLRSAIGLPAVAETGIRQEARKIFVSRADADGRRVLNEDALMEVLSAAGYQRIVPSQLTFCEQVAVFAGASHVIGPHGAGLTNLVFSRPGSQLIELFPETCGIPTYYLLCAGTNRPYYAFLSRSVVASAQSSADNFIVDPDELKRCAGQLL